MTKSYLERPACAVTGARPPIGICKIGPSKVRAKAVALWCPSWSKRIMWARRGKNIYSPWRVFTCGCSTSFLAVRYCSMPSHSVQCCPKRLGRDWEKNKKSKSYQTLLKASLSPVQLNLSFHDFQDFYHDFPDFHHNFPDFHHDFHHEFYHDFQWTNSVSVQQSPNKDAAYHIFSQMEIFPN